MAAKTMLRDQMLSWLEKHRAGGTSIALVELATHFPRKNFAAILKAAETLHKLNKANFDGIAIATMYETEEDE